MKIGADSVIVLDIRQYAGVLFLVIIRFSLAEKSCGVFAREKWRQRKRGAVGRLAPVNATRNVGRYLYPQNPYVLLLSEGTIGIKYIAGAQQGVLISDSGNFAVGAAGELNGTAANFQLGDGATSCYGKRALCYFQFIYG